VAIGRKDAFQEVLHIKYCSSALSVLSSVSFCVLRCRVVMWIEQIEEPVGDEPNLPEGEGLSNASGSRLPAHAETTVVLLVSIG
jgi:hypothetical protein